MNESVTVMSYKTGNTPHMVYVMMRLPLAGLAPLNRPSVLCSEKQPPHSHDRIKNPFGLLVCEDDSPCFKIADLKMAQSMATL